MEFYELSKRKCLHLNLVFNSGQFSGLRLETKTNFNYVLLRKLLKKLLGA